MFELDSRLQADTWVLGDFPLSRLLLNRDANYPWFILVPRREGVTEVFELSAEDQMQLARESAQLAQGVKALLGADKMNVATLGNVVAQLHVHVIARYSNDPAWPAPVWGKLSAATYQATKLDALKAQLKSLLRGDFEWAQA